jgi:hypothetical protein
MLMDRFWSYGVVLLPLLCTESAIFSLSLRMNGVLSLVDDDVGSQDLERSLKARLGVAVNDDSVKLSCLLLRGILKVHQRDLRSMVLPS